MTSHGSLYEVERGPFRDGRLLDLADDAELADAPDAAPLVDVRADLVLDAVRALAAAPRHVGAGRVHRIHRRESLPLVLAADGHAGERPHLARGAVGGPELDCTFDAFSRSHCHWLPFTCCCRRVRFPCLMGYPLSTISAFRRTIRLSARESRTSCRDSAAAPAPCPRRRSRSSVSTRSMLITQNGAPPPPPPATEMPTAGLSCMGLESRWKNDIRRSRSRNALMLSERSPK